jgi:Niemann-Pick C1 protein
MTLPFFPPLALPNGSPNYQNASALIVTFPVNNHVDDSDNQLAKIWESAMLDFVHNYTTNHTNVTMLTEVRWFVATMIGT